MFEVGFYWDGDFVDLEEFEKYYVGNQCENRVKGMILCGKLSIIV